MYGFVWRRLPGSTPVRAGTMTMILLVLAAVLWFAAFPWASLHLPIDMSGIG